MAWRLKEENPLTEPLMVQFTDAHVSFGLDYLTHRIYTYLSRIYTYLNHISLGSYIPKTTVPKQFVPRKTLTQHNSSWVRVV